VTLDAKKKRMVRTIIRGAIQFQNQQTLFCCEHCMFYDEGHCEADFDHNITHNLVQPHQLPECFTFNSIDSAYAEVLEIFNDMKIDFHTADKGWATIVGRIVSRCNKYGYLINVSQKNLNKYNG